MPIYEYKCANCGLLFEELILSVKKYSDEIICPSCGFPDPEKMVSAAAVTSSGLGISSYPQPNCASGFS